MKEITLAYRPYDNQFAESFDKLIENMLTDSCKQGIRMDGTFLTSLIKELREENERLHKEVLKVVFKNELRECIENRKIIEDESQLLSILYDKDRAKLIQNLEKRNNDIKESVNNFSVTSSYCIGQYLLSLGIDEKIFIKDEAYYYNEDVRRELKNTELSEEASRTLSYIDKIRKNKGLLSKLTKKDFQTNLHPIYIENTKELMYPNHEKLMVNPTVGMTYTKRYTFTNPFMSALPKEIYPAVIGSYDDHLVGSIDIKQQELIIMYCGILRCRPVMKVFRKISDKYLAITAFILAQQAKLKEVYEYLETCQSISDIQFSNPLVKFILKDSYGNLEIISKKSGLEPTINYKILNDYIADRIVNNDISLIDISKITKEQRNSYKTAMLAGDYGASLFTLQKITDPETGRNFYNFLNTLPELVAYKQRIHQYLCTRLGSDIKLKSANESNILDLSVSNSAALLSAINTDMMNVQKSKLNRNCESLSVTLTSLFGTNFTIPPVNYKGQSRNYDAWVRVLLNTPVQTTGSDFLRMCLYEFYRWSKQRNYTRRDIHLLFTKHDELIFSFHHRLLEEIQQTLLPNLEIQVKGETPEDDWLPLLVDFTYGEHYTK